MFRTIASLAVAGLALMPFVDKVHVAPPLPVQQQAVDPFETASLKGGELRLYELSTPSGARCRLSVEAIIGAAAAHADAACDKVYAGLEQVSGWSPSGEGMVRLTDKAGNLVAEIGVSDGFAYEAVSPSGAFFAVSEIGS